MSGLTLEEIKKNITDHGYCNYLYDKNYPFDDEEGKYYKFTASGFTKLTFFLDHIEKNPQITLQELRKSFDDTKEMDVHEAMCIDYLVNHFTGKFGSGGGYWCKAYGNPTEDDQCIDTCEVVDGIGCMWTERHALEGYKKITVSEFSCNVGIFTFSFRDEIIS